MFTSAAHKRRRRGRRAAGLLSPSGAGGGGAEGTRSGFTSGEAEKGRGRGDGGVSVSAYRGNIERGQEETEDLLKVPSLPVKPAKVTSERDGELVTHPLSSTLPDLASR